MYSAVENVNSRRACISRRILTCGMMRSSCEMSIYKLISRCQFCPSLTLTYIKLSTLTLRSSGNCCRHFSKNVLISSPFLHCVNHICVQSSNEGLSYVERTERLTVTLFLCPLPSQNEYITSISSCLISS